ncbi:hypothetical protein LINPERPRIM_LOCUS30040 [Linum perenne]|jgi:hypothetical protein
MFLR